MGRQLRYYSMNQWGVKKMRIRQKTVYYNVLCFLITLLLIGCSRSNMLDVVYPNCITSGGEWINSTNDCSNFCEFKRNISSVCPTTLVGSCNCGSNKCWTEYACEPIERINWTREEINACLNKPYTNWNDFNGESIEVIFQGKSTEFIKALTTKYNISYGGIILENYLDLKINDNLPVEKICAFLNDESITYHSPGQIFRAT